MRVLEEQPCGLITAFDRVLFAAWSPIPADEETVTRLLRASHREAERLRKVATIVILLHHAPTPSDAVRKRIQEDMRKVDPFVICGATVIDKAGFRGSAFRAIVSTMQLISRPKHPERVFATADEAVHFVRAELGVAGFQPPPEPDLLMTYQSTADRAHALGVMHTAST